MGLLAYLRRCVARSPNGGRDERSARRFQFRPFEPLETRWALARYYVDHNANGDNTGESWPDAFTDLQSALAATTLTGGDIWVADGVYRPSASNDRSDTFELFEHTYLYGGFAGFESDLEDRNPAENITILSGDIGNHNDVDDNSYHVVIVSSQVQDVEISGFTIRDGNATSQFAEDQEGGGLRNHGIVRLYDMRFENN